MAPQLSGPIRLVRIPVPARTPGRRGFDGPGDWIALARPFTLLRRRLRRVVWTLTQARPDVDLLYGLDGFPFGPSCGPKPAAGLTLLTAYDFVGLPLLVRGSALAALGGVRPEAGAAAGYDIALRALSHGLVMEHLPLHFAHASALSRTSAGARRTVLDHWNAAAGAPWRISEGERRGTCQVRRTFAAAPQVSIVVQPGPDPDGDRRLAPILEALAAGPWPLDRLEVLADARLETGGAAGGEHPLAWRRLDGPDAAGAAGHRNALWRAARGELVVFLQTGMIPETADWIDALVGLAAERTVGLVSGRVLVGGSDGADVAASVFGFSPRTWPSQGFVHRDFAVPISPLMAARKSALEAVNGFDPRVPPDYQAADMALRQRLLGLSVVVTPFARVRRDRGPPPRFDAAEAGAFLAQWGSVAAADRARFPTAPLAAPH